MNLTFEKILSDLKNKKYAPIYFFMGEEPYFIDELTDYIEKNILSESERDFNLSVLYGKESDVQTILSEAKRFPLMAERTVVIVKEAQMLEKIEEIEPYLDHFLPTTILVFCYKYKNIDKRKSFSKKLDKNHVLFESKKIYSDKIPAWISDFLKNKGYKIEPKASILLSEFLGNELTKIVNALEKLFILLPLGTTINSKHIEENIGISKDFNVFELNNAIGGKEVFRAYQIVNYFASNPRSNPFVLTITSLFSFFVKVLLFHSSSDKSNAGLASAIGVNPFFLKDYHTAAKNYTPRKCVENIALIREFDMRSKGVGNVSATEGELLKELVYKLMH
ncbi:MAG: DNA polymerase III subunit delta [Flavobacteriales bacterium]|nr:DNA polymerase III subunit delta [Flavobacteriales bacterium]